MTTPSDPRIWSETFRVRAYEVSAAQTLSIASLCNYLQEVAGNHAHALGVSIAQQPGLTWMMNRLHVQIDRLPPWRDTVTVETWPSGHNGLLATREFVVRDHESAEIATATSAWIMIDIARRRPVRLPASVDAIPLPDIPRPLPDPFPRLIPPATAPHEQVFAVYPGDLDQNRHANNVSFVAWALHALPSQVHASRQLTHIELDFRAEATVDDAIVSTAAPEDEAWYHYAHAIYRLEGDTRRLLAVARTQWR